MEHVVLAGRHLAGIDRDRAARIDHDDARRRMGLAGPLLLLLRQRLAAQVGQPVIEEVVGLGLERVGADRDDRVGELRVEFRLDLHESDSLAAQAVHEIPT
jgi:hypothetical protein